MTLRKAGPVRVNEGGATGWVRYVSYGVLNGTSIAVFRGDWLERDEAAPGGYRVIPRSRVEGAGNAGA